MKVGIVTVHDSANLGSFLQALGMQELVKQHGDESVIIKTRSSHETHGLFLGHVRAKPVRTLKSYIRFALSVLKHPKSKIAAHKKYKIYKIDWKKFSRILTVKEANREHLDCLLLGSDEIWNTRIPAFQNPYLYGIDIHADKKCAYAVSVGNATDEDFRKFPHLTTAICGMDCILPRDAQTVSVVRALGAEPCARICDPTLQVDIKSYMKPAEDVRLPEGDYMVIYSYGVSPEHRELIQRFAKERGLRTVAVSLKNEWCDEYLNCSPLEFGAILSHAKYVFTSTFHGTIFSALYHTRFVALAFRPKVGDVLSLLGLEDHMLPEGADYKTFCEMLECDYCFDAMEEKLAQLRKESFDLYEKYIKTAD